MPELVVQAMWFMLNTRILPWIWNLGICHTVPMWPATKKNLGRVSNVLPWRTETHRCCHNMLLEELSTERTPGRLNLLFSRLHLIADFALHPVTVINLIHEYNYMLNTVSPQKSQNLKVGRGSPTQIHCFSSWFCQLH